MQTVETISQEAARLFHSTELDGEDLHKILLANQELFRYLNGKYVQDDQLDEEVLLMTRTLYDPVVAEKAKSEGLQEGLQKGLQEGLQRGIQEGKLEDARNALRKGFSLEDIAEITNLPLETIQKLKTEPAH